MGLNISQYLFFLKVISDICWSTTWCHQTMTRTICFTLFPSCPKCMQCIKSILNAMIHKRLLAPNKSRHQIACLINGALHLTWADRQIAICFTHTLYDSVLYHPANIISCRYLVQSFCWIQSFLTLRQGVLYYAVTPTKIKSVCVCVCLSLYQWLKLQLLTMCCLICVVENNCIAPLVILSPVKFKGHKCKQRMV